MFVLVIDFTIILDFGAYFTCIDSVLGSLKYTYGNNFDMRRLLPSYSHNASILANS